jgi:hypothetical protein
MAIAFVHQYLKEADTRLELRAATAFGQLRVQKTKHAVPLHTRVSEISTGGR